MPCPIVRVYADTANPATGLKRKLQLELYVPWAANAKVRIEAAVISRSRDLSGDIRRRFREVWMVKRVEKAGPELKPETLSEFESSLD